jgi:hypothetical protein
MERCPVDAERALTEAKLRWGPRAGICSGVFPGDRCQVGASVNGHFVVLGAGSTWKEAFGDAEERERAKIIRLHDEERRAG